MAEGQAMEVDYDDVVAIVGESKTRLKNATYMYCGTSIDLYKFSNKQTRGWKHGHIFRANCMEDLFFDKGLLGDINARDGINQREACFLVHAPNEQERVQDMMVRSSTLKHVGVLKPYIAGFNTQISQVVSGFSKPTSSLADWLSNKLPVEVQYIPIEVQQLIRTGYLAIERIWKAGSTSDQLADIVSYHMIDNNVKINPLCTRRRRGDEDDMMPLWHAFGQMIEENIFSIWSDGELVDFIELLNNPAARETNDVLEHPVLLLPARRELMYRKFDRAGATLSVDQTNWLAAHADPDWKTKAENEDQALKEIIIFQVEQDERKQAAAGEQAAAGQQAVGFSMDFSGALHFASVTTAHYLRHYKKVTAKGQWREGIKGRVDLLLKKVLPRLLSRRYNAEYVGQN